jgi:acetolactate synthase-1/2/3 large subunit
MAPAIASPQPAALDAAARMIAGARRPLIIAQRGAGSALGFATLSELALTRGIPVSQYWAVQLAMASDHPMSVGVDPGPWLKDADIVVVLDALAPWAPAVHELAADCKVIHVGQDPLYARFPVRNFQADVSLVGETADVLIELAARLQPFVPQTTEVRDARRARVTAAHTSRRECVLKQAALGNADLMTKEWVSYCLSQAIADHDATVLSELGCPFEPLTLGSHQAWYQEPHSGGLGWCFPSALGMQLARPDRLIVATMGDGSYMFSNPVACHQIAEALNLPVLILILNNSEWGAVRRSVLGVYPDGFASKTNKMPLISLEPTPDFTKVAQASRAFTLKVEKGAELASALRQAIEHVRHHRTQALVEIQVAA